MKPPPRRSARGAGATRERKTLQAPMKRRAAARPPRATGRAPLGGIRMPLIHDRGMPAWAPSVLGGICARRGRGRWGEDWMEVGPQPRPRGDRVGSCRPPGGGGGGGGGGRGEVPDPPGLQHAPPVMLHLHRLLTLQNRGVDAAAPPAAANNLEGADKLDKDYQLDVARWMGTIDKADMMGMDDDAALYQPYFAAVGKNQDDRDVISLNKLLSGVYSDMLDVYMDIYKAATKRWDITRSLDSLPWKVVEELVIGVDCNLKSYFASYDISEKYSINLMERVEKRQAEPLRRPPLLEKSPRLLLEKSPNRWWLVLICCERKVLLAGWWLVLICCERKVLLAGG